LTVSATSLDFGPVPLGSNRALDLVITNNSDVYVAIGDVTIGDIFSGPGDFATDPGLRAVRCTKAQPDVGSYIDAFDLDTRTAPNPDAITAGFLRAHQSCHLSVNFAPHSGGSRTRTLTLIPYGSPLDQWTPTTVSLTGIGLTSGLQFQPQSIDFTDALIGHTLQPIGTQSEAKSVDITNTGSTGTLIKSVAPGSANFIVSSDPCSGRVLASGATCSLHVRFVSTRVGYVSGYLDVTFDGPDSPKTVALFGEGTRSATTNSVLSVDTQQVSFDPVAIGEDASRVVTIRNTGTGAMMLHNVKIDTWLVDLFGTGGFDVPHNDCQPGTIIPAGGSCPVTVNFYETEDVGYRDRFLDIDTDGGSLAIPLRASPQAPVVSFDPAVVAFSNVPVGGSATAPVSFGVMGTVMLRLFQGAGFRITGPDAADFSVVGGCGDPLARELILHPGALCSLQVTVRPSVAGIRHATLELQGRKTAGRNSIPLVATTAPLVATPPKVLFPDTLVGQRRTTNVTLANPGIATLPVTLTLSGRGLELVSACGITPTGNSASVGVPAGSSCDATVALAPTGPGLTGGFLTATYAGNGSPITVPITGAALATRVEPGVIGFSGTPVGVQSLPKVVIVDNAGPGNATPLPLTVPPGFTATHSCPTTMAPGDRCYVYVTATPTAAGPMGGDLVVGTLGKVALSGVGLVAHVFAQAEAVGFTAVAVGQVTKTQVVTFTNDGGASASILSDSFSGANASDFQKVTDGCIAGNTLPPRGSCSVTLRVAPSASGARTASLDLVTTANPGTPVAVALAMTGATQEIFGQASNDITPQTTVTLPDTRPGQTSGTVFVRVVNTGSQTLTAGPISATGDFSVFFPTTPTTPGGPTNCTVTVLIAAGGSCYVGVRFTPTGHGVRNGTLRVPSRAPGRTSAILTGVAPALDVSTTSLDFGPVAAGRTHTLRVTVTNSSNTDTAPGIFRVYSLVTSGNFAAGLDCVDRWLAAGESCSFDVTFASSTIASFTGSVDLAGTEGSRASVALHASTFTPSAVILAGPASKDPPLPDPIDLGSVEVGTTSAPYTIYLTNTSPDSIVVDGASVVENGNGPVAGLAVDATDCQKGLLAAAGSCALVLSATPQRDGVTAGAIKVASDATVTPVNVTVTGTAPAKPPTILLSNATAPEGSPVTLTAVQDNGRQDPLTYAWDTNGDGIFETSTSGPDLVLPAHDGPAVLPISVLVTHVVTGAQSAASAKVSITAVAPTGSLVAPTTVTVGQQFDLAVTGVSDAWAGDIPKTQVRFDCGTGKFGQWMSAVTSLAFPVQCDFAVAGKGVVLAQLADGDLLDAGPMTLLSQKVFVDAVVPPPPPPTVPGIATQPVAFAGAPGTGSLTASWAAPTSDGGSPILDYVVALSVDSGPWQVVTDPYSDVPTVALSGLQQGGNVQVRVRAVNAVGASDWSLASTAVLVSAALDKTPPEVAWTGNVNAIATTAQVLHWTATDNIAVTAVDVYSRTAPFASGFGATTKQTLAGTADSLAMPTAPGATTCVRVRAWDAAHNVSGLTPWRCSTTVADESAMTASTGWAVRTDSRYFGGRALTTQAQGATLTIAHVTGTKLVVLTRPTLGGGSIGVYVAGVRVSTVHCGPTQASGVPRVVVPLGTVTGGAVVLKVDVPRTGVTIDGFAVVK
jgi:hypothetical protein